MMDILHNIKKIAIDMRNHTSNNDTRYEAMQDIIELCDEGITHFINDGK